MLNKKNCTPSTRIGDDLSIKAKYREPSSASATRRNLTQDGVLSPRVPCNPGPGRPIPWSAPVRRSRPPGPSRSRKLGDDVGDRSGSGRVTSGQVRLTGDRLVSLVDVSSRFPHFLHPPRGGKRGRERVSRKMREKDAQEGPNCKIRRLQTHTSASSTFERWNVETRSGRRSERGATADQNSPDKVGDSVVVDNDAESMTRFKEE